MRTSGEERVESGELEGGVRALVDPGLNLRQLADHRSVRGDLRVLCDKRLRVEQWNVRQMVPRVPHRQVTVRQLQAICSAILYFPLNARLLKIIAY